MNSENAESNKTIRLAHHQAFVAMPRNRAGDVLGRQVLRSGTSIGANYREALRASSRRHFVTTLEIAIREGEETAYWLELLAESEHDQTFAPLRLDARVQRTGGHPHGNRPHRQASNQKS